MFRSLTTINNKIQNFGWNVKFMEFILLNIYALCFLVLIIQIHIYSKEDFFCNEDTSNFIPILFSLLRKTMFIQAFYGFFIYYAFETCYPKAIDKITIFILIFVALFLTLLKLYNIDTNRNFLSVYLCNFFIIILKVFFT